LFQRRSRKKREPLIWSNNTYDWFELFDFLVEVSNPAVLEGLGAILELLIMMAGSTFEALAALLVSLF
jgi:hypothetical protein